MKSTDKNKILTLISDAANLLSQAETLKNQYSSGSTGLYRLGVPSTSFSTAKSATDSLLAEIQAITPIDMVNTDEAARCVICGLLPATHNYATCAYQATSARLT